MRQCDSATEPLGLLGRMRLNDFARELMTKGHRMDSGCQLVQRKAYRYISVTESSRRVGVINNFLAAVYNNTGIKFSVHMRCTLMK